MEKAAVSNSTPLIYLAKIEKIMLLKEIFEKVYIPQEVFEEVVVKGRELNKKEIFLLEELIEAGAIEVKNATGDTKSIETLHEGEIAAISLAKELEIKTLLIDDREGLGVAKVFGLYPMRTTSVMYSSRWQRQHLRTSDLHPMRTTAVLLVLYRKGVINYKELRDSLLRLSQEGYFMGAEIYNELIKKAKKLEVVADSKSAPRKKKKASRKKKK